MNAAGSEGREWRPVAKVKAINKKRRMTLLPKIKGEARNPLNVEIMGTRMPPRVEVIVPQREELEQTEFMVPPRVELELTDPSINKRKMEKKVQEDNDMDVDWTVRGEANVEVNYKRKVVEANGEYLQPAKEELRNTGQKKTNLERKDKENICWQDKEEFRWVREPLSEKARRRVEAWKKTFM